MKKIDKIRLTDIVNQINNVVNQQINQSDFDMILADLKLSKFKVRAIEGELDQFLKTDRSFLVSLWKIERIDAIVDHYFDQLSLQDRKMLFRYLDSIESRTINEIEDKTFNRVKDNKLVKIIRLEVFKDRNKIN